MIFDLAGLHKGEREEINPSVMGYIMTLQHVTALGLSAVCPDRGEDMLHLGSHRLSVDSVVALLSAELTDQTAGSCSIHRVHMDKDFLSSLRSEEWEVHMF